MAAKKKSAAKKRSTLKKKSGAKKKSALKKKPARKQSRPRKAARKQSAPKKKSAKKKPAKKKSTPKMAMLVGASPPAGASSPLTIDTKSLPTFNVGQDQKVYIKASGGTRPYSFMLVQGTLPAGLSFNTGGALYGEPVQDCDTTISIRVTDSATGQDTQNFVLVVQP